MADGLIWSVSLAAIGILGIYLAGSKNIWGWAVSFGAQAAWIVFAIVTTQYGFIVSALAYGWVYGRNFIKWRRETACRHRHIRCVHGDEINHLNGARVKCIDCDKALKRWGLPATCTVTGKYHDARRIDGH